MKHFSALTLVECNFPAVSRTGPAKPGPADAHSQPRRRRKPKGDTMQKLLAALAVLTLLSGTVAFAAPANASNTYLFPPTENAGSNS